MPKSLLQNLKSPFYTGLRCLLPLIVSVGAVRFILKILSEWLSPLAQFMPASCAKIPYIEVIVSLTAITLIGFLIHCFNLNSTLSIIEKMIIQKIPFIKQIYFAVKQILVAFTKNDEPERRRVAWVRLPYRGMYCLGFMTGKVPSACAPIKDTEFYSFFVPTTPNPVAGYYVAVCRKDCIFVEMSHEEAISMIISGGMIGPER